MPVEHTYRLVLEVDIKYPSIFNPVKLVRKEITGTLNPENPGKHLREIVEGMLKEVKEEQQARKRVKPLAPLGRRSRYYD
jgi:hypothetical protein